MNINKYKNGIKEIGILMFLVIILLAVLSSMKIFEKSEPLDLSENKDLVIIKVFKDSSLVAQVATIPDKPVSFGNYKVVFQKRR